MDAVSLATDGNAEPVIDRGSGEHLSDLAVIAWLGNERCNGFSSSSRRSRIRRGLAGELIQDQVLVAWKSILASGSMERLRQATCEPCRAEAPAVCSADPNK